MICTGSPGVRRRIRNMTVSEPINVMAAWISRATTVTGSERAVTLRSFGGHVDVEPVQSLQPAGAFLARHPFVQQQVLRRGDDVRGGRIRRKLLLELTIQFGARGGVRLRANLIDQIIRT